MTETGTAPSSEPRNVAGSATAPADTVDPRTTGGATAAGGVTGAAGAMPAGGATPAGPSPAADPSMSSTGSPHAAQPPPVARRGRGVSGTVADMARSLGVLIACVAVVWFVSGMWHVSTHRAAGIADWRSEVTDIAPTAAFPLQAPATLPAGWAVSALQLSGSGSSGEWTMSVTTPAGHYLDLDQAAGSVAARVGAQLPAAVADGRVVLTAGSWSRYRLPADAQGRAEMALAREVTTTAVLISGTGTLAEQSTFADALRTTR